MPTLTFTVNYDGTDAEIMQALSRMAAAFGTPSATAPNKSPQGTNGTSSGWDKLAHTFAGLVSHAASNGRNSQLDVMQTWLKNDGNAELDELVRVSGVAKTHDFAGVSSGLTRNMVRAGGAKRWYEKQRNAAGKRVYKIQDGLVAPLRRAFNI